MGSFNEWCRKITAEARASVEQVGEIETYKQVPAPPEDERKYVSLGEAVMIVYASRTYRKKKKMGDAM